MLAPYCKVSAPHDFRRLSFTDGQLSSLFLPCRDLRVRWRFEAAHRQCIAITRQVHTRADARFWPPRGRRHCVGTIERGVGWLAYRRRTQTERQIARAHFAASRRVKQDWEKKDFLSPSIAAERGKGVCPWPTECAAMYPHSGLRVGAQKQRQSCESH